MTEYEAALRAICPLKAGMKNSYPHHIQNYPTNFQLLLRWQFTGLLSHILHHAVNVVKPDRYFLLFFFSFFLFLFFPLIVKQLSYVNNEKAEF